VISLGQWENCSETKINDDNALLVKSTIKCNVSGEDIKIVDSGQKADLTELEPVTSPEMKIYDAYWIDEDYNEQRDLNVNRPVTLYIQMQNYIPGAKIEFYFEDEDNEGWHTANRSGIVGKDGIVEIKDFQVKPTKTDI